MLRESGERGIREGGGHNPKGKPREFINQPSLDRAINFHRFYNKNFHRQVIQKPLSFLTPLSSLLRGPFNILTFI